LIVLGKPWQSGDGESFNGKFRDECLSLEWFRSRAEARVDRDLADARAVRRKKARTAGLG
jgi:hypothetical protein